MLRYLLRRLLLTLPVLLGVATLVFALIHLGPGDPAQAMLGESASADEIARLRTSLGLDRPLVGLYGPTDPAVYGPVRDSAIVVRGGPDIPPPRRRTEVSSAMLEIGVDQVVEAARMALERQGGHPPTRA